MSKLTPLMVTIIENKGGIPDQWKAAAEKLVSKPEEYIKLKQSKVLCKFYQN